MSESNSTRASLLVRVCDHNDRRAWDQFVEIYSPMVHRYCRRAGLQDADATDVVQEVMVAVSRAIGRFDHRPGRATFRNWLFTITRNELRTFLSRDKRRRADRGSGRTTMQQVLAEQPDEQETRGWEEECRVRLFEWAASRARREFADPTWRAFVMTAVEGKPVKEVEAALGLSANAVYTARSRVLARLKQLIAQEVGEGELD
jgi:RNA polymerase sigma-70 factor (ECF subfamily)